MSQTCPDKLQKSFFCATVQTVNGLFWLKVFCCLVCFGILASNLWSISHWNERRGVFDDLCYLRQAHLFQRFGLAGLDTSIAHDDDHFFRKATADIGHIAWSDPTAPAPLCHTLMSSGKWVIQYPPGTGFLLSLFPEGSQVIGLFAVANLMIFFISAFAIALAPSLRVIFLSASVASATQYFMINPVKASYSAAPTMVLCAAVGYLTGMLLFSRKSQRSRMYILLGIGLLLGIAVNIRIANILLSAGYLVALSFCFFYKQTVASILEGVTFSGALVVGLMPTLAANAINAGAPFSTTYGAQDTLPVDLTFGIAGAYFFSIQGCLILLALLGAIYLLFAKFEQSRLLISLLVTSNVVLNSAYFFSHPVFTPYYMMPIAMLSIWTLLFYITAQSKDRVIWAAI